MAFMDYNSVNAAISVSIRPGRTGRVLLAPEGWGRMKISGFEPRRVYNGWDSNRRVWEQHQLVGCGIHEGWSLRCRPASRVAENHFLRASLIDSTGSEHPSETPQLALEVVAVDFQYGTTPVVASSAYVASCS